MSWCVYQVCHIGMLHVSCMIYTVHGCMMDALALDKHITRCAGSCSCAFHACSARGLKHSLQSIHKRMKSDFSMDKRLTFKQTFGLGPQDQPAVSVFGMPMVDLYTPATPQVQKQFGCFTESSCRLSAVLNIWQVCLLPCGSRSSYVVLVHADVASRRL